MSNNITAAGLVWEEPPASRRRADNSVWEPIAAALKANPGKWARISEDSPAAVATNIRSGGYIAFREGHFEAKSRSLPGSKTRAAIYARYIGPEAVTK